MTDKTYCLTEIANIRTGVSFRGKLTNDSSGDVLLLDSRAVVEGAVVADKLVRQRLTAPLGRNAITDRAVLICSKGPRNYAIVAPRREEMIVATNYFLIVDVRDERVDSEYLAAFLNLASTQDELRARTVGSLIKNLSKQAVASLPVKLPSRGVQARVVENARYMREEVAILKRLSEKKIVLWENKLEELICS